VLLRSLAMRAMADGTFGLKDLLARQIRGGGYGRCS